MTPTPEEIDAEFFKRNEISSPVDTGNGWCRTLDIWRVAVEWAWGRQTRASEQPDDAIGRLCDAVARHTGQLSDLHEKVKEIAGRVDSLSVNDQEHERRLNVHIGEIERHCTRLVALEKRVPASDPVRVPRKSGTVSDSTAEEAMANVAEGRPVDWKKLVGKNVVVEVEAKVDGNGGGSPIFKLPVWCSDALRLIRVLD